MSRLNDIIRHVAKTDPQLARDLQRETDALADRRAFGLNFERHVPEAVELPGRPIRKNDKVRILPDRRQTPTKDDERLYRVTDLIKERGRFWANVQAMDDASEEWAVQVDDLVVVAEFREPIYPGLVPTGRVERGGDKPFHTVINAENYHALQALLFTHRGKVDCIYIDPPYNTGAKDWKYNDHYVDGDDHYRHSKWLAFLERRLKLARELLTESGFCLISIDDREAGRLRLLCDQVFGEENFLATFVWRTDGNLDNQATIKTNHEYVLLFAYNAEAVALRGVKDPNLDESSKLFNDQIRNSVVKNGPKNPISSITLPAGFPATFEEGTVPARQDKWPHYEADLHVKDWKLVAPVDATTGWANAAMLRRFIEVGLTPIVDTKGQETVFELTHTGAIENVKARRGEQHHILTVLMNMGTVETAGNAIKSVTGHTFPYPKPVPLMEYLVSMAPANATVLDFFAGSGTTFEAVARLNAVDGEARTTVLVTNNEVSESVATQLTEAGHRQADPEWCSAGLHESVTRPRVAHAAEELGQNVEFFTLTYESAMRVSSHREFPKIAPFLWLRAGSRGRRIDDISTGWDVAEAYGVIANLDQSKSFIKAVEEQEGLTHVFIVTDEDRLFEAMVRQLPEHIEPVRLYSSYLRNFEIEAGRSAR